MKPALLTFNWSLDDYRFAHVSLKALGTTRAFLYFSHNRFNNGRNRGSKPGDEVMVYRQLSGIKVNDCCAHVDLDEWEAWFEYTWTRLTTHGDFCGVAKA